MDTVINALDSALRTLFAPARASRPSPAASTAPADLSPAERRESAALMRVNHVGEVCAQALYTAQALGTRDPSLRRHLQEAAREESDHLAWTRARLDELGASPSLLNPLWYAGSLAMGLAAGRAGDRWSLGFMAETERQVEAHLGSHLEQLPPADTRSRHIVEAMQRDEMTHARRARELGGAELPTAVRQAMRATAKVMTTVAQRV